ncbi:hypothetical protein [Pseudomonas sp. RIT-PI-S]|uniref:hypothetical protein n=1 Tax=Pseudomonas sp. RIT-PI-S TaxID=3035295 RepID=UPI0021D900D5|nr:hypothetical protein [Pseudomonas sp. RIT-PI-S]
MIANVWFSRGLYRVKFLGFASLCLLIVACKREHVDAVYISGTTENTCMNLADSASQQKYGTPTPRPHERPTRASPVWIAGQEFKFKGNNKIIFHNMYLAFPQKNQPAEYIEGIWAGSEYNIPDLADRYPEIFGANVVEPRVLFIRLQCSVGGEKSHIFNKLHGKYTSENIDERIGIKNYYHNGGVAGVPIDQSYKNPDGGPFLVDCDDLSKRCFVSFVLVEGVLVQYDYPMSQRSNWQKIHNFIVEELKQAGS